MTRRLLFKAIPYVKEDVTLALESGVDGLIVPDADLAAAKKLARCEVIPESAVAFVSLKSKKDEEHAAALVLSASARKEGAPELVALTRGWEVIPVENLIASAPAIAVEAASLKEAELAKGILERGVDTLVLTSEALPEIKAIAASFKFKPGALSLSPAVITQITPAGMGHRVCVDTTSLLHTGQGMLVGNSSAFTFLVNAETEPNEYVAARPFRINAGGVHAYAQMPGDRTAYLEELHAGSEVLIVSHTGATAIATVGRVKVERRPMLLLEAEIRTPDTTLHGSIFLQNAETIRLVTPEGQTVSVVELKPGDQVLCRADRAGRHFGIRIEEDIREG
jgi:3-dehydroquinate synthase II